MLNIYFDDDKRNFADWTKEKVYKALYNLVTYMNENPGSKDNISICYSFDYLMSVYFYLNGILDHYSNASFIVNFVKEVVVYFFKCLGISVLFLIFLILFHYTPIS